MQGFTISSKKMMLGRGQCGYPGVKKIKDFRRHLTPGILYKLNFSFFGGNPKNKWNFLVGAAPNWIHPHWGPMDFRGRNLKKILLKLVHSLALLCLVHRCYPFLAILPNIPKPYLNVKNPSIHEYPTLWSDLVPVLYLPFKEWELVLSIHVPFLNRNPASIVPRDHHSRLVTGRGCIFIILSFPYTVLFQFFLVGQVSLYFVGGVLFVTMLTGPCTLCHYKCSYGP